MSAQITLSSTKAENLLFRHLQATERLGELFAYEVEFQSQDTDIDLSGLLKSPMVVKLATEDGYERYFHGMVCEVEQTSVGKIEKLVYADYRARLVPKPWLLGRVVDCRIFKHQTTVEIARTVLGEVGYTDLNASNLSGTYPKREYCVQYREDGLNFIQRLFEQEGIYYFFEHTGNAHTMVLADGVGSHATDTDFNPVAFMPGTDSRLRREPAVTTWTSLRGVDGARVGLTDYNPLTPKASLLARGDSDGHGAAGNEVFDYPGTHADAGRGGHFAQIRAEAMSAARSRYAGTTDTCSATIGRLFKLADYPRQALNQEYLIVAAATRLEAPGYASGAGADEPAFQCSFEALESRLPYRHAQSARWPRVAGLQTAIVTGSQTDEDIAVDRYGRVQVNFHWNMPDKPHADCSCPVRVASSWAGKSWGAVSWPRVGQEVVVSFIEGDPDRPLIIGSVYNADNMPPYALPDDKTQSGIKSRSLLGETADFNELRFEDKKGSEDFFIHAQKDMHEEVEHDHTATIDHDEIITVKHDQTATIQNNRTHTVDKDDSLTVNQNGTTSIGQVFKLTAGEKIQFICGESSITLNASGEIQISGTTISVNGMQQVNVAGRMGVTVTGMNVNVEADLAANVKGTMTTLAANASATVQGAMVNVTGSGMVQVSGGIVMLG